MDGVVVVDVVAVVVAVVDDVDVVAVVVIAVVDVVVESKILANTTTPMRNDNCSCRCC